MKKDYRNKEFTLVEMIVVIVIIGILLAILVPGMFRYIQKAKEQQAIVECRAVVTATDTLALELYGKDKFDNSSFLTNYHEQILSQSDVKGEINSLSFKSGVPTLNTLLYRTQSDILVLYDTDQSSVYQIVLENDDSHTMKTRIEKATKLFNDAGVPSSGLKWNNVQNNFYSSEDAKLTSNEKEILSSLKNTPNSKIGADIESYKWIPCKYTTAEGKTEIFLAATLNSSGYIRTPLVYYNNQYYYWIGKGPNSTGVPDTGGFSDTNANTSVFGNALSSKDNITGHQDTWVRIDK